jgi:hypothetical protein
MSEPEKQLEQQVHQQTGQQEIRVRVEDRTVQAAYANAVLTNATADEVILDFGIHRGRTAGGSKEQPEILIQVAQRVVMNLYTAKQLTLDLGRAIRRHEEQFGTLEMDMAKRLKKPSA